MSLQYNDTTNKNGLLQVCEEKCNLGDAGISGVTLLKQEFTRRLNQACHVIWTWIFESQGGWKYDDGNQSNLPCSYDNLVSGTRTYAIDTNALTIQEVRIHDAAGNPHILTPATEDFLDNNAGVATLGVPTQYFLRGTTLKLNYTPNYNSTASSTTGGIRLYFDRAGVEFTTSDTTKTPGFASIFHEAPAIKASIDYLIVKRPTDPTLQELKGQWVVIEKSLRSFYGKRFPARKPVLRRLIDRFV